MATEVKTLMSDAFIAEAPPARFLQDKFETPERYIFAGEDIEIDEFSDADEYAVDVIPYGGGRANKFNLYTRKKYTPPMFNEYTDITAKELGKVFPGRTKYQLNDAGYAMDFADIMVSRLNDLRKKISRGVEIYARDALFYGFITLINGDTIDYKLKPSHIHTIVTPWTSSGSNALSDFVTIGDIVLADGFKPIVDAIFGSTVLTEFLDNDVVKELGKMEQIVRVAITSPMVNDKAARYHGTFSAGNYKINIWSYPQSVRVPTGFSLPNEGTKVPYIPTDRVCVLTQDPDFRLYYAATPSLANVSAEIAGTIGMTEIPALAKGMMIPYAYLDRENQSVRAGVRSRPLPIPTSINEVGVIKKA